MLAIVFPALRHAEARTDISIDFFYDNLGDDGSWIEAGDYGYCWQPSVAVSNASWRPYSDGYWAYTDVGWTWVSYEDFGWATYHYGRWIRLRDHGWVWAPGREWGPAWVSWRTGGDYVGWAPLPPRRGGDIYVNFTPITASADIDYDIGPAYYNFIDVRYIGEPVLRDRIFAENQNVTYVSKTVNVTNINSKDSEIYNYGPDFNTVSRYSTRPIQRLTLQREANFDPAAAARSNSRIQVQGDRLVVAAPQQLQTPPKPIAPKVVKEKLAEATVEHGWEPVGDARAQAALKDKITKEDPKVVPPPTVQAAEKPETASAAASPVTTTASATPATGDRPAATASAPPAATGTPSAIASASPKAKGKDRRNDAVLPAPNAAASVSPALTPATPPEKNRNRRDERVSPLATPSASVPATTNRAPSVDKARNKQRDAITPSASVPPATGATEPTAPTVAPRSPREKQKVEPTAVAPPGPLERSVPRVAPAQTPETRRDRPAPDATRPEAAVEKTRREPPTDVPAKVTTEQAPQERVTSPSTNAPASPPATRDEGKKNNKSEAVASPTP
jgi:hypothetical protein